MSQPSRVGCRAASQPPGTARVPIAARPQPEDTENEYEAEPGNTKPWSDPLQFVDRGEAGGYSEVDAQDEAERY